MFAFLKRLLPSTHPRGDEVVFLVNLPEIPAPAPSTVPSMVPRRAADHSAAPLPSIDTATSPSNRPTRIPSRERKAARRRMVPTPYESTLASHRARLLAMRLEHLSLCPATRCRELAAIGVQTAGDLVYADLSQIAKSFGSPDRAERAIRRYRAAIKLALGIDSMMPRDALLLVAIHRRSVASVARESAAQLHRDLERFSLSSRGSKLVGQRSVPSLRRVKSWVATCRAMVEAASEASPQIA